jgi:hypothetical protein
MPWKATVWMRAVIGKMRTRRERKGIDTWPI